MKRLHIHVHVEDLSRNVAFYSAMFGAQPTRSEVDYAKWMLDEPAVNFAISTLGQGHLGVDHLGIQVDTEEDLTALKEQAKAADMSLIGEGATSCCYARSDKHWLLDPQGLPWEHFRTLGSIPVFSEATPSEADVKANQGGERASCAPRVQGKPIGIPVKTESTGCC